jgi:hypothetical protein
MTADDDLETSLRRSLAERADGVEATPALWRRVADRTGRRSRLGPVLGAVGLVAAVTTAVVVLPGLRDTDVAVPDIAEEPDAPVTATPGEPATDELVVPGLAALPMAVAQVGEDGLLLRAADGDVLRRLDEPTWDVVTVVAGPGWTPAGGVVGFVADTPDGTVVGTLDQRDGAGTGATFTLPAAPNGDGLVVSPDGEALAWLEGTDLHVLPLASEPAGLRVLPLERAPDGLVLQQWVDVVDAPTLVATAPGGGVWSLPIDVGGVTDTAPTAPAIELPVGVGVTDAAYLPDLRLVTTAPLPPGVAVDGATILAIDDDPTLIPAPLDVSQELVLTTSGELATLVDPTTGAALLLTFGPDGPDAQPIEGAVTALAPLAAPGVPTVPPSPADTPTAAPDLGLVTDASLLGTDGRSLLLRTVDGTVEQREVYPAESEAALGLLAVRPGSTPDDGIVAVVSSSEGETSIRFVGLLPGTAAPVGDVAVADGDVTGLVWSQDGQELAWSDAAGLHLARVALEDDGAPLVFRDRVDVPGVTAPVVDWVWDAGTGRDTSGRLLTGDVSGLGVVTVERVGGVLSVGGVEPVGPARPFRDTHATSGAAVGPSVGIATVGRVLLLDWSADGDLSGDLPEPGTVGPIDATRVRASGGQVLVQGPDRAVEVTFDGRVSVLPSATDWDVLD